MERIRLIFEVQIFKLLNQSLRNRNKLKEDAISQLSDKLVELSARLQEIERKQQLAIIHTI